jgi:hypothetical protein
MGQAFLKGTIMSMTDEDFGADERQPDAPARKFTEAEAEQWLKTNGVQLHRAASDAALHRVASGGIFLISRTSSSPLSSGHSRLWPKAMQSLPRPCSTRPNHSGCNPTG